ncbi:hypothetical protein DACRYDRAFT_90739 [Dacryopinax primogenitus]|uniref:Ubiquitin-like 1-activating enzyme E1A n=1 Tax=Dacryopinax primogenitus (strain DJM 731) TaxID=1858805 RepID=M5G4E3_DACPD|nr:uncharacterized protein DACRYDRAFT_90739 [Dacryopinax primogenitus]EJT98612.1 hypothetical protein DACRYDRAFT_90739 [Dacryopinax primogenitus]
MASAILHDGKETAITEDEAALYDRQIRLWGFDAQTRMRNASVLVINLRGTACEVIKNIVLAGIGTLKILDERVVEEEDLGAGFFFREDDVGKKRVDAALPRIAALNPLVNIVSLSSPLSLSDDSLHALFHGINLVCATDCDRVTYEKLDEACHKSGKQFYCGGTMGWYGYAFCDLGQHSYVSQDQTKPNSPQTHKTFTYVPLSTALRATWSHLTKRDTKELNPAVVFSILAVWEYQARHSSLPEDEAVVPELLQMGNELLGPAQINKLVLKTLPSEHVERLSTIAAAELSPICAILGGFLAQDMLKAIGGREAPMANFFTFDGILGGGTVCRLGMKDAV